MLRYDARIIGNGFRAAFSGWRDRVLLATVTLLGMGALRSRLEALSVIEAATAGGLSGLWIGFAVGCAIDARLSFHASETPFSGDALSQSARRRYFRAWHGAALAGLAMVAILGRASVVPYVLTGYLTGAVAGYLFGFLLRRLATRMPVVPILGRPRIKGWQSRPLLGAVAAITSIAVWAGLWGVLPESAARPVAIVITAVTVLLLTPVDDAIVRFAAIAGQGPAKSILVQAKAALVYMAIQTSAVGLLLGRSGAGLTLLAGGIVLALLVARVLAYRVLPRRPADLLLTALSGFGAMIATTFPALLPPTAIAALAMLYRRAARATWMMA